MNEILQANIFFFITSVSVIVLTIFIGILLYYGISLVRTLKHLARVLENEAGEYVNLSQDFREGVKDHPLVRMFVSNKKSRNSKREN